MTGYNRQAEGIFFINSYNENLQESILSSLSVTVGRLLDANINRSPSSYEKNRAELLERYSEDGNTDKNFTQLNIFETSDGQPIGLFNWFAVHPTCMNRTNTLINGDVKG